jgi:hypothetical protein
MELDRPAMRLDRGPPLEPIPSPLLHQPLKFTKPFTIKSGHLSRKRPNASDYLGEQATGSWEAVASGRP